MQDATFAAAHDCALFTIFQNLCEDMPMMNGCQGYNKLCATGTVVEQCLGKHAAPRGGSWGRRGCMHRFASGAFDALSSMRRSETPLRTLPLRRLSSA